MKLFLFKSQVVFDILMAERTQRNSKPKPVDGKAPVAEYRKRLKVYEISMKTKIQEKGENINRNSARKCKQ